MLRVVHEIRGRAQSSAAADSGSVRSEEHSQESKVMARGTASAQSIPEFRVQNHMQTCSSFHKQGAKQGCTAEYWQPLNARRLFTFQDTI